ncbi:MAG: transposase [Methanosarcinaceae archaeon]|jgi:hypothetical protein|nr:transposase [Methanosarcinaceae archaeon]
MIHVRDHKTAYLIDPWEYLGPKRRKLLDTSWAGLFRKHILSDLPVHKLASHYAEGFGRPTKELYAVMGALILQQMHDLTDEETVSQFSFNLQWHYALDIPSESDEAKYLSAKTLWTLRNLVTKEGLDRELFTVTTETLARVFGVDTSQQRIDSVHIRSNMRRLGRISIFSRTIHRFLINLKRQHRKLFETIGKELLDRYLTKKALECFSLVKPSESPATLERVSKDLLSLVEKFRDNESVRSLSTFGALLRVLDEQCILTDGDDGSTMISLKAPKEVPSSSLQNPSDPDATYDGHKGQGYQVQAMETYCDSQDDETRERTLNLITYVEVEPAHISDVHALIPALESAEERGLFPKRLLADAAYGSQDNVDMADEIDVEVVAPVKGGQKEKTITLSDFPRNSAGKIAACPQGHKPVKFSRGGKGSWSVAFDSGYCTTCPLLDQCPVKKAKKRHYLRFNIKALRTALRRAGENSPEFKEKYRWRSGVEATFSEMDAKTGIKRLRVRGLFAVSYSARLKAIGVNILRATRVKRVLEDLKTTQQTIITGTGSMIYAVKERFLIPIRRIRYIFISAAEKNSYMTKIAA